MAKFTSGDLRLKDGQKVTLGTSLDSNLWWDASANGLRLDTTISGVDPTQDYHLVTKSYVDAGGGAATLLELTDTPAGYDDGKYLTSTASGTEWGTVAAASVIVTVGSSGADYDNFDDAIDYLRTLNGGTIVVTSNMTITSTAIKDITNITFNGDIFYSGTRQINKTVNGGYWYGKNVVFKTLWFYRLSDAGANEIFRYTEDYQDVTLEWTSCIGFGAMGSPAVFNCNGKEAHIVAVRKCLFGSSSTAYMAFSNASTLVANLFEGSWLYATGTVDSIAYDASCVIEGSPTYNTPDNPVLMDKASAVENDSTVSGTTVKDALENLNSGDITDFVEAAQDAVGNVMSGAGNVIVTYDDPGNLITVSGSGGGVSDHGGLTGLGDDDHQHYSLVDGTRAFTGVVGGITPTSTAHLTTKGYVDSLVQGLDWQESVLSITTEYGSAVASGTNRYVAPSTSGTWTDNYIYEWGGSSWTETIPTEGAALWAEDTNRLHVYNGTDWVLFGSIVDHGALNGLADDDHTQYILVDGSRGFTATVSGVTPTQDYHLATKSYVDAGGIDRHGLQAIANGTSTVTVNFADLGHTDYTVNATLENITDSPPSIYAFIVSAITSSSFTVTLMGDTDSANYKLNWSVIED